MMICLIPLKSGGIFRVFRFQLKNFSQMFNLIFILLNIVNINSSIYQYPFYPKHNKLGITIAGIPCTTDDKLSKLFGPTSVYLDSKQNIYVSDTLNRIE